MIRKEPIDNQEFMKEPQVGELVSVASGYSHYPAVVAGFGKSGNVQVYPLRYYADNHKKAIPTNHTRRLVRIDQSCLTKEDLQRYSFIMERFKK